MAYNHLLLNITSVRKHRINHLENTFGLESTLTTFGTFSKIIYGFFRTYPQIINFIILDRITGELKLNTHSSINRIIHLTRVMLFWFSRSTTFKRLGSRPLIHYICLWWLQFYGDFFLRCFISWICSPPNKCCLNSKLNLE